jgi:cobalt-zinc-cadmium efflux system outer membrane protein
MLRRVLPLVGLLWAAALVPGCAHCDPDQAALAVAHHLADLPRDQVTQDTLNAPRVKPAAPVNQQPQVLKLPPELPGAEARPLVLPDLKDLPTVEQKEKALAGAFPELPPLESDPVPSPGPGGVPLDLPALQAQALANNPIVQQAATDVQAARGGMIQAGLYPNPNVGYQGDQINAAQTAGQQGGFIEQTFKTGGKLGLARSVGSMDVRNAEVALRRAQIDVMTQVRTGYFAVLVAQENLAIARAMSRLADQVYRLQLQQVVGGQAAGYEPLQLHVLAVQARGAVVQAHNRYLAAWQHLAAALGQPGLPPTQLAGRADTHVPCYELEAVRQYIFANHTDLATARNTIQKGQYHLALQRAQPIPDITSHLAIQKDMLDNPHTVQAGVLLGVALPVFDHNQGNILQAEAQLAHANREVARVENDLTMRLAEAFERYRNNVTLVLFYRDSILPNQVRVYRAIYQRYHTEPGKVQYSDLVVAEQTLAQALTVYVQSLMAQWQAVVDLGALLQTDDLYQLAPAGPCEPPPQPVSQMLDATTWTYPAAEARPGRATLSRPIFGP